MSDLVQQVGGFWQTLRHDGIDYGSYIEHLTYLLFLNGSQILTTYPVRVLTTRSRSFRLSRRAQLNCAKNIEKLDCPLTVQLRLPKVPYKAFR